MKHTDQFFPDPREGKIIHVRFTLTSGVAVTRSCTYRPREYSSPAAQIMAEDPLFRRPVEFIDVREVEPLYRRPNRRFRISTHQRIISLFGTN